MTEFTLFASGAIFGTSITGITIWWFRPALFQRATQTIRYRTLALVATHPPRLARLLAAYQPHTRQHRTAVAAPRGAGAAGAGVPMAMGTTR